MSEFCICKMGITTLPYIIGMRESDLFMTASCQALWFFKLSAVVRLNWDWVPVWKERDPLLLYLSTVCSFFLSYFLTRSILSIFVRCYLSLFKLFPLWIHLYSFLITHLFSTNLAVIFITIVNRELLFINQCNINSRLQMIHFHCLNRFALFEHNIE